MKVSFEGFGELSATFYNNDAADGWPVYMDDDSQVAKCASGARFAGVALHTETGFAQVQLEGYIKLPYTGTAPTVGYKRLVADGSGAVKVDSATTGGEYLVLDVDESAKTVGFIL